MAHDSNTRKPLPPWVKWGVSAFVLFHLGAVAILALDAPSGPWQTPLGIASNVPPPPFVERTSLITTRYYLVPLGMNHNYHFLTNHTEAPEVKFEVKLKDADGNVMKTLEFPSKNDNYALRARHRLLARIIADDEPYQRPVAVVVPAPGQPDEIIDYWYGKNDEEQILTRSAKHLMPKDRMVFYKPREHVLTLAKAYVQYLCREHGANSGVLVRTSIPAPMPEMMVPQNKTWAEEALRPLVCNFGEFHLEN